MKKQHNVKIYAVTEDGVKCSSHNCGERVAFKDDKDYFVVTEGDNEVTIRTRKGIYTLPKHNTLNTFTGTCKGVKVRVNLKKMVGTVTYWS